MYEELKPRLEATAKDLGFRFLTVEPPGDDVPAQILVQIPETMIKEDAITCLRLWGKRVRMDIPESEDGWAWAVIVLQDGPLGLFWGGWKGREDQWTDANSDETSDSEEWLQLYQRLSSYLARLGHNDVYGNGDFFLRDENLGYDTQYLRINNIEILTPTIISDLQALLQRDFPRWCIWIDLALMPPVDGIAETEHLIVRGNQVEEAWDKDNLRARLGNRFKL